jgi:MerR family transcriptional regulator, light-induced transcriptional regulator
VSTTEGPTPFVSTEQAARALGVSVSTVKRWVDEAVLPAHKTPGGHRKILTADVLELARRGVLPHADLALLAPRRPAGKRAAGLADGLYRALLAGDGVGVRGALVGGYRQGVAVEALADEAVGPAMRRIGQDWAAGRIDVMEEHRASQLCAAALYELKALLEARAGRAGPRAVGGSGESDYALLPPLLAQLVLLDAGWEVTNLGANTPFRSFARALEELRPRLMWISVTHLADEEAFVRGYRRLYQQAEKAGVAVAVGGGALGESIRTRIPYTTYGDGLTHLAAFARTLYPRPGPPRRGRPRKGD